VRRVAVFLFSFYPPSCWIRARSQLVTARVAGVSEAVKMAPRPLSPANHAQVEKKKENKGRSKTYAGACLRYSVATGR